MKNRNKGGYEVLYLKTPKVTQLAIVPNLCPEDPALRTIMQDVRFRRALSLALNREEIKVMAFLGEGRPAQATTWKGGMSFEDEFEKSFVEYDPERADRLLDEMGLSKRDQEREHGCERTYSIHSSPFLL